ncbi:hypothetical protein K458DRAFT_435829 [Lentithecium fluviatile CBS 122367]|uniref:Ubiquitin 3 binding protein But2 C-terminal domain-containing protein n=1 Tax=Lentithecium fluviatile CBS 122367 TaxID=1168545 RepID=A0A6G1IJF4_9PLEO|nr:hypothetical protein K458DRAFT_435829 [Lentithecium fluviatile CBS 122367]
MILSTILLLPLLTDASPLSPRACKTAYPTFTTTLDSTQPNQVSNPQGNNPASFGVHNGTKAIDTIFQFNIPAGSYGCQLELFFDPGYYWIYPYPVSWAPHRADIHTLTLPNSTPLPATLTWNTAPAAGPLFGTTGELPKVPDNSAGIGYKEAVKRVINSATCQSVMAYRLKTAPEVVVGGVQFYQYTPDKGYAQPWGGWRMVYDC